MRVTIFVLLSVLVPGLIFAAPVDFEVRNSASGYEIRVGDQIIHRTELEPLPLDSGSGVAGRARFTRWQENGEIWFSFSRDGGSRWSEARPLTTELRMRAGTVALGEAMPLPRQQIDIATDSRVFLVELKTISLPEWRSGLTAAGAELLGWFPRNAHIVRVDREKLSALRALPFVERVEPYLPSYRMEPLLQEWITAAGEPAERRRVRMVAFEWGEAGKERIAVTARALGVTILTQWPTGHLIELELTRDQLRILAGHDDVQWIDRWSAPETDMDLVREDGGTNFIEATLGYCGEGVRAEVMDSGLQDDHVDLDGALFHTAHSVDSHGTSTYGIVFSNGDRDGDGQARALGTMPCAEQGIFAQYDQFGDRFTHTQELLSAPYFAVFQTNSWGDARTFDYTSVSQQMDDIIWRLDFPILQSQSNSGTQDSRPQAWAKNIISVGGIRHQDTLDESDDAWSGGASIGPAADGRLKPDVNYWYDNVYTTTSGGGYTEFGGTSAATPEVAGILGLMNKMYADNIWLNDPQGTTVFEKRPHASTAKALLINNAKQYDFTGSTSDLTRTHQGWGRPNLEIAYNRAPNSFIVDEELNLQLDETASFDVQVPMGETELKVTMIYPDPPGVTSASLHRINDVDLKVISPVGDVYHGNVGLEAGNYSTIGGLPNDLDTVENVFVSSPLEGIWKVEVYAAEINQDAVTATPEADVTFALVVTGGTGSICDQPIVDFSMTPNPARVGEAVQFTSTVSAGDGVGGPYTYAWDFNRDGLVDSTDPNPVYAYPQPYEDEAALRVRDVADCPQNVRHPMSVFGPDLQFDSYFDLIEVTGNGNGSVDPGEVWDVRIRLRNDGSETAVGVSAALAVDPSNDGPITMLVEQANFPDIAVGGTGDSLNSYRFKVGDVFVCGLDAIFAIRNIASLDPVNTYPDELGQVLILVGGSGAPVQFYGDSFESNVGWSSAGGGEWQFQAPQGLGGQSSIPQQVAKPDPTSAIDGTRVLGNDQTGTGVRAGSYENDVSTTITSPPIDASGAGSVELRLFRWLNTEASDESYMEISNDGFTWTRLFEDTAGMTETVWQDLSYDVSAIADTQSAFRIRFGLNSDAIAVQGGWNIDDLRLWGVTRDSCEPFAGADPGEATQLTVDKEGPGDLRLNWMADCGAGDMYAVYRGDLAVGYGSLASEDCAVAGTTTLISAGAPAGEFFLIVPLASGQEGSYGGGAGGPRIPAAAACGPAGAISSCVP